MVLDGVAADTEDLSWMLQNEQKIGEAPNVPILPLRKHLELRNVQTGLVDVKQVLRYVMELRRTHNERYFHYAIAGTTSPSSQAKCFIVLDTLRHVAVQYRYYEEEEQGVIDVALLRVHS